MTERFGLVSDISRGEWLRSVEAEPFGSILSVVPRGFEAYVRVFHPVERDRPRHSRTWRGVDERTFFDGVGDIAASLEIERATWADAAASFGTIMHAEAQYARLVRRDYGNVDGAVSADGWRYGDTREGGLDPESLATASVILARHTSTPTSGIAAIWDGWGGLAHSTAVAQLTAAWIDERPALLSPGAEPGTEMLSRGIATWPRFGLHGETGRNYVLFEAGVNDFANRAWPSHAPWVDEVLWAQSPSILWPEDHSWVLATEIDFDSTLIAGSNDLIRELVLTTGIEALPIHPDADLTWQGDQLNHL